MLHTTASQERCPSASASCRGCRTLLIHTIISRKKHRSAINLVDKQFLMGRRIVFRLRVIRGLPRNALLKLLSHLIVASPNAVVVKAMLLLRVECHMSRHPLRLSQLRGQSHYSRHLLHPLLPLSLRPPLDHILRLQPTLTTIRRPHLLTFDHLQHQLMNM